MVSKRSKTLVVDNTEPTAEITASSSNESTVTRVRRSKRVVRVKNKVTYQENKNILDDDVRDDKSLKGRQVMASPTLNVTPVQRSRRNSQGDAVSNNELDDLVNCFDKLVCSGEKPGTKKRVKIDEEATVNNDINGTEKRTRRIRAKTPYKSAPADMFAAAVDRQSSRSTSSETVDSSYTMVPYEFKNKKYTVRRSARVAEMKKQESSD